MLRASDFTRGFHREWQRLSCSRSWSFVARVTQLELRHQVLLLGLRHQVLLLGLRHQVILLGLRHQEKASWRQGQRAGWRLFERERTSNGI